MKADAKEIRKAETALANAPSRDVLLKPWGFTYTEARSFQLGLSRSTLLIPFYNTGGELAGIKCRHLGTPHTNQDRYKWASSGQAPPLYFPPGFVNGDDDKVFISEGPLKSVGLAIVTGRLWLALASGCRVGIPTKEAALKDRHIFYIQDPDKEGERVPGLLTKQLKGHVRSLQAISFPASGWSYRGQAATDINDVLKLLQEAHGPEVVKSYPGIAAHLERMFAAAPDLLTPPEVEEEDVPHPYRIIKNKTYYLRETKKDGVSFEVLASFAARVTEEIILDDGVEASRAFQVEGTLADGGMLPSVQIPANRFSGMNWITEHWGLSAVVSAGMATKDRLREAIQCLSSRVQRRAIYTHTGWREVDGEWVYLTSGGAVGRPGFEVDLPEELQRYKIPRAAHNVKDAMEVSLRLLDLAPLTITAPLWAAVYRAPLAAALPIDHSIWIEGQTGTLKSTLAALFLSHYGMFDRLTLPGNWRSTANLLERRAFHLKDVVFLVDDYAPGALDQRELEQSASRLLRAQGNLAGRSRLRADLSERRTYVPRGLIVSTGEQRLPGQSILARMLLIEMQRDLIDLELLTAAQQSSERLQHAMAGFVSWLGPQMAALPSALRVRFRETREKALAADDHLRMPEIVAHLMLGIVSGFTFAETVGAISATESAALQDQCWQALLTLSAAQSRLVEEERPTRRFLEVLHTLITQGKGQLHPKDGGPMAIGDGPLLGWFDEDHLYLSPEGAFKEVSAFCRASGEGFPVREVRLRKDLLREKVLVTVSSNHPGPATVTKAVTGRLTTLLRIGPRVTRVLCLSLAEVRRILGFDLLGKPKDQ